MIEVVVEGVAVGVVGVPGVVVGVGATMASVLFCEGVPTGVPTGVPNGVPIGVCCATGVVVVVFESAALATNSL